MNIPQSMKNNAGMIAPKQVAITDKDVYIHPKLKEDLEGLIANIQRSELFGKEMGYSGILFTGPPGTGKTLYAQWIVNLTGAVFYDIGLVTSPDHIRQVYQTARESRKNNKSVILFMDEVDRFSNREDIADPAQAVTLNQLLMELDGTTPNQGIYTIAASNKPEKIDNALRRPGRFGKEIYFLPPDEKGRLEILRIHAYNKDHKFEVNEDDLKDFAKITYGYTGADLKGVLIEAFVHANLGNRIKIEYKDLEYAFKKIKPSAIRDMPFKEPQLKLDDLCGYDIHKEVLRKIVESPGYDLILFYGPDGNGKTAFAESLAGEYGYNFIVVNASQPLDKFVGETEKMLSKYFERAKQLSPSILLFDKVDALVEPKGTTSWRSSWTGLLESKLAQPLDGVTVIATLCDPTLLNDTFIGMFTHKVCFDYPNQDDQIKLWQKYIGKDTEINVNVLTYKNDQLSCRDITQICKRIKDFNLPQTQEVYLDVLEAHKTLRNDEDYEEMRMRYGDSVLEYQQIKHILEKNNKIVDKLNGVEER